MNLRITKRQHESSPLKVKLTTSAIYSRLLTVAVTVPATTKEQLKILHVPWLSDSLGDSTASMGMKGQCHCFGWTPLLLKNCRIVIY